MTAGLDLIRGLAERPDDWWSEDWVGSCTTAGNPGPDGSRQGLSTVDLPGVGPVALQRVVEALPDEMLGAAFADRYGAQTGVLVKLLSPSGAVPLHAHPTRAWARQWFSGAVRRHDNARLRGTLHRTGVNAGEVYVAHAGVPHYLGPRLSFIEVQEPSDHIVIPETSGDDDAGATMGLGWDLALDMIDYSAADAATTFARARQQPRVLRTSGASREVRLLHDDVTLFFDATALEVPDEIEVSDGRFSIAIVTSGAGVIEGDFGSLPLRRGQCFALPASVAFRVRADTEPVRVVRCLGPVLRPPSPHPAAPQPP
jgi:mannose-6-phosphate isomerase